jgi:glycosyltransferase involved in cell wall biosynthesis
MWGISDEDILIGAVGSLIKRKRITDLIGAIAMVVNRSEHPVKCMVIGKGPEKENLLVKVKERNLDNRIIFTDFQSDAISYINALDIFVMPSEKEGLPRVILEAMLMGKPVIASDITGPSELVIDGETGFLVPVGKPDEIADAIFKLIENPEMRKGMGERAMERAVRNFPIEKYINDVKNVFAEVLEH